MPRVDRLDFDIGINLNQAEAELSAWRRKMAGQTSEAVADGMGQGVETAMAGGSRWRRALSGVAGRGGRIGRAFGGNVGMMVGMGVVYGGAQAIGSKIGGGSWGESVAYMLPSIGALLGAGIGSLFGGAGAIPGAIIGSGLGQVAAMMVGPLFRNKDQGEAEGFASGGLASTLRFNQPWTERHAFDASAPARSPVGPVDPMSGASPGGFAAPPLSPFLALPSASPPEAKPGWASTRRQDSRKLDDILDELKSIGKLLRMQAALA